MCKDIENNFPSFPNTKHLPSSRSPHSPAHVEMLANYANIIMQKPTIFIIFILTNKTKLELDTRSTNKYNNKCNNIDPYSHHKFA